MKPAGKLLQHRGKLENGAGALGDGSSHGLVGAGGCHRMGAGEERTTATPSPCQGAPLRAAGSPGTHAGGLQLPPCSRQPREGPPEASPLNRSLKLRPGVLVAPWAQRVAEERGTFPATATLLLANYKSLTNTRPQGKEKPIQDGHIAKGKPGVNEILNSRGSKSMREGLTRAAAGKKQ